MGFGMLYGDPDMHLIETYARSPVRMWTVPEDDYIAYPTPEFYQGRMVKFSNEGNSLHPRWVALDRHNGYEWYHHTYHRRELVRLYDSIISSKEGFELQKEPNVALAPPPAGAPLMSRIVYFLSRLA